MKLKNIKIQGFKSFDDATQINFDDHITCIVGPNGCGKSNVVDAISWVMGEQSAKHLRGKHMEDIIFIGSESRQASSLASVEMTFIKDGASNFPHQYENCSEIAIKRHLYRTGESEYFINKQLVRLKDITDLFLGTGVGTKAYSIIEQGRVEQLITSKPEDRRYIIEEAAGISKFKSRKEAAMRRIDATNQNLSRLNDIIVELERQVASLDRQAKKAKRFRVIRDELKDLDLKLASLAFQKLDKEQNEYLDKIKEADARSTELSNEIATDETWVDENRLELAETETALNDLQQKVYEWENSLQLSESKLQNRKNESHRIQQDREQTEQELKELDENLVGNQNGLKQINERLCDADLDCAALDDTAVEHEQRLKELEVSSQKLFAVLEKAREDYNRSSNQMTELSTRREGMQHRLEELEIKKENDQTELDDLTSKYRKLDSLLKDSHTGLADVKQLKLSLTEKTDSLIETLKQEEENNLLERDNLEKIKEELLQKKHRLQSLRELEKNFEGYHEGPRQILKRKRAGELEAVMGSVADFLEVDKRYENAVSAVLGETMQSVVVPTTTDGMACAEYLKSAGLGRSSFIAMSLAQPQMVAMNAANAEVSYTVEKGLNVFHENYLEDKAVAQKIDHCGKVAGFDFTSQEGVHGWLSQFVSMKSGYEHLSGMLFEDVVLADSIQNALEAWIKYKKPVVTVDGEFISSKGVLTGGTLEDTSKSLLEKRREIKVLDDVVQKLIDKVAEKETVCIELKNKITALKTELEDMKSFSHKEDLNIAHQEKDIDHYNREIENLNSQRGKISQQIFATVQTIDELKTQLAVLQEEEEKQIQINEEASQLLESRKTEEDDYRRDLTLSQEHLTKEKIDLARAKEQKAYLSQEAERLVAEDVRLRRDIIRLKEKKNFLERQFAFVEKRIAFFEKLIQKMLGMKDKLDVQYQEAKNGFETVNNALREREHHLKTKQREYNTVKDTLNDATVHLTELRSELARNNEQMLERYQLVLSEIYQNNLPNLEEFDVAASKEQAGELRRKMGNIGSVNMGAIDELDELQARFEFLTTQRQDLEESLRSLEKAIQKINRTTKKRFADTFELVNEKFKKLFPRLFKGGYAYLELTDPENILETGVDIIAEPPGKKLQSVSLLSGGEKALTAISLLFAIFLIKPSPFCLLDEVDAPLDDVNVDRYNEIVKELSQSTQFIVITHNKRTMQSTNCLFGVTMQEDGVSKVVSVAMDE